MDTRFQTMAEILNSQMMNEQTISNNGFLANKIRRIFTIRVRFLCSPGLSRFDLVDHGRFRFRVALMNDSIVYVLT